jgi:rubrerythrin
MKERIRHIVREARRLEALSMTIYVRLGEHFRDAADLHAFWMSMARHEAAHVGALELLEAMLEQAGVEIELPTSGTHVEAAATAIEAVAAKVHPGISIEEAFALAIELEGGELEDLVLDLIHSLTDDTQRDQAAMMLVHDLSDLSLMIEKYTSDDDLLAKADALVERHIDRREGRRSAAT